MSLFPITRESPAMFHPIRCFVYGSGDPSRDRFKVVIPHISRSEVCDLKDEIMHRAGITGEGPAYKLRLYKVKGVNKPEDGANINKFLPGTELVYPEDKLDKYWGGNELYEGVIHVVVVLPSSRAHFKEFIRSKQG
ncbi:hypothetical protein BDV93DRAFT_529135 [Ceratobasidium sp. AG-I]|nr:hypothetical protein BDV93DRAFT_529135 [Ceratobasidium sp. AG-I]